jgi:hypothetical protein
VPEATTSLQILAGETTLAPECRVCLRKLLPSGLAGYGLSDNSCHVNLHIEELVSP